jgi:hypothetical protein
MKCLNASRAWWIDSVEAVEFVDAVDPVVEFEAPRSEARSFRRVARSGLPPAVLFVLFDELLPESAETRLLKSDWSVLRVLFVDDEEDELSELACNREINCSSPLEKFE